MEKILNLIEEIKNLFKRVEGKKIINYITIFLGIFFYLFSIIFFKVDYALILEYVIFLIIPILMILITIILNHNKKNRNNYTLIILIYLVFVFSLIITNSKIKNGLYLNGIRYYNYNLIPFKTLKEILILGNHYGLYDNILFYNLILFIPFAIFLPLVNKNFKKTSILTLTMLLIGFLYEGIEYLLLIGVFDVDMIILRVIGGVFIFLIIYKTKLINKIKEKLPKIKINYKILNNCYIILFIFLIILATNIVYLSLNQNKLNKVSISGTIKCGYNEQEIGISDNYRYYSRCMGDYSVIYNNNKLSFLEFIERVDDISKYMDKFKLRREKIITDVKVKENSLIGKKMIKISKDIKEYYYNIDSIEVRMNDEIYKYEDYLNTFTPEELDLSFSIKNTFKNNTDGYTLYVLEYFNALYCDKSLYYLPKTYKVTKNTCNYLEKLK